ncbi:ABC transporter permease [Carnobacterium gallinarum]|uniref:ABC transporter permease n=1 Tax=Carnobacterium gallinarum TaxID=2749 RepID=UPI00055620AE|nr:ABC transporter permease [Carnobacterium gallinarum]
MSISMRKVNALFMMKLQMILKNFAIMIGPLMAIGFVLIFNQIMPTQSIADLKAEGAEFMVGFYFQFGVMFNVLMTGIMASSIPLAEEKEKNTLRVLMTSSVNALEFFLGSLLPVLVLMIVINILLLPISGMTGINIPIYILVTTIASFITIIIGSLIGLISKDQKATSLISTPIMLVLMMLPMFAGMNSTLQDFSKFFYTGSMNEILINLVLDKPTSVSIFNSIILAVWLVSSLVIFVHYYRKNGLDRD